MRVLGASRPGTLGVRPLTGSVATADCRRRLRAKTSVAHAAACPTGKGLHTSAEAALALFGTDGGLVGGDAGPWWTDSLGEKNPFYPLK